MATSLLKSLGLVRPSSGRGEKGFSLPLYSPIAGSETSSVERPSQSDEIDIGDLQPAQHRGCFSASKAPFQALTAQPTFQMPTLTRFLADFTLGFADGLTVPFALTAGLSSLGQTDTVIYAGMAEICAGSISMGIGGYLSARGENAAAAREREAASEAKAAARPSSPPKRAEKNTLGCAEATADYLALLDLPPHIMDAMLDHIRQRPDVEETIAAKAAEKEEDEDDANSCKMVSPIISGLSISLGYVLGGILPLFPYFLVSHVGDGLYWSIAVCLIALFSFGFTKDFVDSWGETQSQTQWQGERRPIPWRAIGRSSWEGLQMVILGSAAALAAVLCVRAFEASSSAS